jgi:D-tyrosyl-tRNA(Tyr) deacylase
MRALVQRVHKASVTSEDRLLGSIGIGFLVLLGVADSDTEEDFQYVLKKIPSLRVFSDQEGKMNLSVRDVGGAILLVSQFTLIADTKKGNRPSFIGAARPEKAKPIYERFAEALRAEGIHVETGEFGADMDVELVNHGPVTIMIDSRER